jgi:hypothetical protein
MSNIQFMPADWDALRKVEKGFREVRDSTGGDDPLTVISDVIDYIDVQGR